MEWIEQVRGYTRLLLGAHGTAPSRVVVTNGRWLLVIKDPNAVFTSKGRIPEESIRFYDGDEVQSHYNEIASLLGFESLCSKWRPLVKPEELSDFLTGRRILACFRGVATSHLKDVDPFAARPMLKVWPATLILRDDGAIVSVISSDLAVLLRPEPGNLAPDLAGHLQTISAARSILEARIAENQLAFLRHVRLRSFRVSSQRVHRFPKISHMARKHMPHGRIVAEPYTLWL
ncbi:hypothetical protein A4R29_19235 [Mesorhizobium ciceri biovar biserrulae]|nr:hypothetical protein A4R29_19235 [Mesorhizobium ciceri biovar biserrulae]